MNRKMGMAASAVTFAAVLAFAICMVFDPSDNGSYVSSLFISWGFVPMICAFAAQARADAKAAAYAAIGFAAMYAVMIGLVYFAQITTVRMSTLTPQAAALLDFSQFGLFFSYDLLGYAFMSMATFFIGLTIAPTDKCGKLLKTLLLAHGVFAVSCVVLPMLGVFKADMPGGDLIGTLVLEFWCVYFMPVCALAWRHFRKTSPNQITAIS